MTRTREIQVALVLLLFSVFGIVQYRSTLGEDLASSYFGCKLLAAGLQDHLYSHDSELFNVIDDDVWDNAADEENFEPLDRLHPYVQTPLWAYALQPLCTHTTFRQFNTVFLVLTMLCLSGVLWIVARLWTPALFHPVWIALLCTGLYLSEPLRYALFLSQTHILFIFLTVAAITLARRCPLLAGAVLALAALVKITPGYLVFYWLVTRQNKAALSFTVTSVLFAGLTVWTTGSALVLAYLHTLSGISNVLLVAFNNQSFAAWWMAHFYPASELFIWRIYPLPTAVKIISLLGCIVSSLAGGFMDLQRSDRREIPRQPLTPPFGAVFAMVGATLFSPIAWTHYFVLLIIPVMLLLARNRIRRSPLWLTLSIAIVALNLYPLSIASVAMHTTYVSLARSQFYAAVLSLIALVLLRRPQPRPAASQPKPTAEAALTA